MEGTKAILLMAGSGQRFGGKSPKQFQTFKGKPLYLWSFETLQSCDFEQIILVCHLDQIETVQKQIGEKALVIEGGKTRQESSYLGLLAAGKNTQIVLIHDAARPFVSKQIIYENIERAKKYGAVDTCIPSTDTLVYAPDGETITSIPKRCHYLRGQTPQTFSYPLILQAHQTQKDLNATDDCQLVVNQKHPVHIVKGSEENIKITTSQDLAFAQF